MSVAGIEQLACTGSVLVSTDKYIDVLDFFSETISLIFTSVFFTWKSCFRISFKASMIDTDNIVRVFFFFQFRNNSSGCREGIKELISFNERWFYPVGNEMGCDCEKGEFLVIEVMDDIIRTKLFSLI